MTGAGEKGLGGVIGFWWGAAAEVTAANLAAAAPALFWQRQAWRPSQVAEIMLWLGLGVPLTCITLYWVMASVRGGQHLRLHLLLHLPRSGSYWPLLQAALQAEHDEPEERRLALVRFARALDPRDVADAALSVAGPAPNAARAAESVRQMCRAQQARAAAEAEGSSAGAGEACVFGIVLSQPDETNLGAPGVPVSLREQTLSVLASLGDQPSSGSEYRFYCFPPPGGGIAARQAERLFSCLRETM